MSVTTPTRTKPYKIFTELDEIASSYKSTSQEKVPGLKRSQYQVIRMCEFYSDSKYMGANLGNVRRIGRGTIDVPFYNIVNFRVALAKTATDLDIKDIQITADHPNYQVESMLLNREAYEWMKEAEFAKTLNTMGQTRPKYGGYLIKKVEKNGKLDISVVRWTNVYTGQNNILREPIVENHHMTPVELNDMADAWDKDTVRAVLKAHKAIKNEKRPNSIDVYEITGEFPKALYSDADGTKPEDIKEEDKYIYSLQRHFVADLDSKKYLLHCDELSGTMEDYYEYLTWEDNGYALGRGVIEDSEEAQVWTNDAVINESIAMQLAGRVGIKTNSKKLGNNILEHDHGKIYELEKDADINSFNLAPQLSASTRIR